MQPMIMNEQDTVNYRRIAAAIQYIQDNVTQQPSLDDIAKSIHVSPYHMQKLFTNWAGVSPKKFLQYVSVEHAKRILADRQTTLLETAHRTGLSGTGRLHDLFVTIEGMTPGEYKHGGKHLAIHYSFASSPFGDMLVASTGKGICSMAFADDRRQAVGTLRQRFPQAQFTQQTDAMQQHALALFTDDWEHLDQIKLHLRGTDFQLKVWEALLNIPMGALSTYGAIAKEIAKPRAARAVGTAIGSNPVAFLIPCHRVIQASGVLGNYMWGADRKTAMIGWEAAKTDAE